MKTNIFELNESINQFDKDKKSDVIADFEYGYNKKFTKGLKNKVFQLDSEIENEILTFYIRKVKAPGMGIWGNAECSINFKFEGNIVSVSFGKLVLGKKDENWYNNTDTLEQKRMFKNVENGLNKIMKSYSIDSEIKPNEFEAAGKAFAVLVNKKVGKYLK